MNPSKEALLISRIIDGTTDEETWSAFEEWAERESGAWRRLGLTLRNDQFLTAAIDADGEGAESFVAFTPVRKRFEAVRNIAVALLLLGLGYGIGSWQPRDAAPVSNDRAPEAPAMVSTQAPNETIFLGEYPSIVLESRPMEGGGLELVYVRRIVERRVAQEAFEVSLNEQGQAFYTPTPLDRVATSTTY